MADMIQDAKEDLKYHFQDNPFHAQVLICRIEGKQLPEIANHFSLSLSALQKIVNEATRLIPDSTLRAFVKSHI